MQADVLIVGGGSAGCVLASRLSETASLRVLLLEAGPDSPSSDAPDPVFDAPYLPRRFSGDCYWTDLRVTTAPVGNADPEEHGRDAALRTYDQARMLGGGSSVNGQIALRGLPRDYDAWAEAGATGWGWDDVLPYFRKLECDLDFAGPLHGREGPILIRRTFPSEWPRFASAFREAVEGEGVTFREDAHADPHDGLFPFPRSNVHGRRISAASAYLRPAVRARPNLAVVTGAEVERVLFEGARATGVSFRRGGAAEIATAPLTVLCGGAIQSPTLLMRSGVGPADHLSSRGIAPVVDSPQVGANLQDHPLVSIGVHLRPEARMPASLTNPFLLYLRFSSGLDGCPAQDMKMSIGAQMAKTPLGRQFGAIRVGPDKAFSRGWVRLARRPADSPAVAFNLLSDERDRLRTMLGVRRAWGLATSASMRSAIHAAFPGTYTRLVDLATSSSALAAPFQRAAATALDLSAAARRRLPDLVARPRGGMPALLGDEEALVRWVRETAMGNWHACGTCRMGSATVAQAVVDPRCAVNGVEALHVVDASVIPEIPCANTNLTVMMIAEKMAERLRADLA